MSLPGLGLAAPSSQEPVAAAEPRQISLSAGNEWRFETSFDQSIVVKLLASTLPNGNETNGSNANSSSTPTTGTAELFGTELAPNHAYTFSGVKGAIYTHHGCSLAIERGTCESEYVAEETPMTKYINFHFALETIRRKAAEKRAAGLADASGPRVLVVGPENAGKTSLIKMMTAYAVRGGRTPLVVNLDPREGMLSLPGSVSAAVFGPGSVLDIEDVGSNGWGNSPIAGPSTIPVKMPLVYHYGSAHPDDSPEIFKPLVTRVALAATSRLEEDAGVKDTGLMIDLSGKTTLETIAHVVSEFSVNVVAVLGSERLFSDVSRRFSPAHISAGEEPIEIVKLSKSGGCVDRDDLYIRTQRYYSIRNYFFGGTSFTLSPHSQTVDLSSLRIWRMTDPEDAVQQAFLPGGSSDEASPSNNAPFVLTTPNIRTQNALLTIKHAAPGESQETILEASVAGYLYVVDVDEVKKKVQILSPAGGRLLNGALVWGRWPEGVANLVG